MLTSTAVVVTDAPARYAKQLLSHLGHKVPVEELDGHPGGGRLVFAYGAGIVRVDGDRLVLEAVAVDLASLARVEDVLARHLLKFGRRGHLTISWDRGASATG